ncbi:unnamed protein product, partial [Trichogramma brassicae]
MVRSTMKASRTRMLPPTVNTMQIPKASAMSIVCHSSNGGSTGVKNSSPARPVAIVAVAAALTVIKDNVRHRRNSAKPALAHKDTDESKTNFCTAPTTQHLYFSSAKKPQKNCASVSHNEPKPCRYMRVDGTPLVRKKSALLTKHPRARWNQSSALACIAQHAHGCSLSRLSCCQIISVEICTLNRSIPRQLSLSNSYRCALTPDQRDSKVRHTWLTTRSHSSRHIENSLNYNCRYVAYETCRVRRFINVLSVRGSDFSRSRVYYTGQSSRARHESTISLMTRVYVRVCSARRRISVQLRLVIKPLLLDIARQRSSGSGSSRAQRILSKASGIAQLIISSARPIYTGIYCMNMEASTKLLLFSSNFVNEFLEGICRVGHACTGRSRAELAGQSLSCGGGGDSTAAVDENPANPHRVYTSTRLMLCYACCCDAPGNFHLDLEQQRPLAKELATAGFGRRRRQSKETERERERKDLNDNSGALIHCSGATACAAASAAAELYSGEKENIFGDARELRASSDESKARVEHFIALRPATAAAAAAAAAGITHTYMENYIVHGEQAISRAYSITQNHADSDPIFSLLSLHTDQLIIHFRVSSVYVQKKKRKENSSCQVVITLSVIETTDRVVLHAEKLKIDQENVTLRRIDSDEEDAADVRIKGQSYDEEAQFFTIELEASLPPGSYELSLRFDGSVLDDLFGFYRSSYKIGNETRWLGVTQFSPTFARRAFPCFDEPGFKATFQLRLGHYDNETATSNSPEESDEIFGDDPSYHVTKFSETPRMSTYLLGWSIHSFQRINSSVDGRFSLWTRSRDLLLASSVGGGSERVPLCLVEMPAIYSALENYTDLSNPIDKFDIFAVPDFNFQAMENWAFVTMRESVALISYEATSLRRIHGKLTTMGHELAHTWFGNVVTPFYWNVAWLKEAFATYFAYLAIGQVHEDWRMMDMFATEVLQDSLLLDSADHERRMNGPPLGTAAKAKAALDFVTYRKGKQSHRQYEAVTPPDFYKSLEDTLIANNESFKYPVPFGEIIDSWANQSNYPVVQVSRIESGRLLLNQEIFKLDRGNESSARPRQWWIPIKIVCAAGVDGYGIVQDLYWFEPSSSKEIELPEGASENGWFILNPHQVGHYRVDYDPENWELLMSLLDSHDFKRLTGPTRAALVDDAFNLARADFQDYYLPLELIKYLTREDEYEPWLAASRAINLISRVLVDRPHVKLSFETTRVFKRNRVRRRSETRKLRELDESVAAVLRGRASFRPRANDECLGQHRRASLDKQHVHSKNGSDRHTRFRCWSNGKLGFSNVQVLPEWRSVYQQVIKSTQAYAFLMDSTEYSHPMNNEIEKPDDIMMAFDGIAYQKGGSVIRMMQHFLGEDVFQKGLQEYLRTNAKGIADSDELFKAISTQIPKESSLNLTKIMNSWVDQPGYPVIKVTRNYDAQNKTDNVLIQQERYLTYNGSQKDLNYTWYVPINYATTENLNFSYTKPETWLAEKSKNLTVDLGPEDWIILNKQQT